MPNELNTNSRFVPESHFFTEVSAITQSAGQAFGPVSEDVFRLTAKFTATAGTKAFAICPGIVAIQPQTGSTDKVNLILRPYKQPIQGVNIRYFVYRGLTKSDFIDANGKIILTTAGVSDFIQKINEDFAAFHADEEEMPVFDATFIGYRETVDMNAPFDTLFFSVTEYTEENEEQVEVPETAFELPKINQGKSLGTFAAGECGIDVILNYGDFILNEPDRFSFDFNYARAAEATIDLTSVTDPVSRKRRKEQLFQFIDIAAFYGFHCTESGKVTTTAGGSETVQDVTTIYDQVLTPFASKNTYYLYIQSDRERSYDFYGTYRIATDEPENMLFGTTEANLAPRVYATNGWPIILETASQEHEELFNTVCLQLVTDNNPNTVLYGQTACVDNALRNHFSTIEELQQPIDIEDEEAEQPLLTTTIIVSNPAVEENGIKKHIANFGILVYQGASYNYIAGTQFNEEEEEVNVYAKPNVFDDVFGNITAIPLLNNDEITRYRVTCFERLQLMAHRFKGEITGVSAVQISNINDTIVTSTEESPLFDRVIYTTTTTDICNSPFSPANKISSDIQTPVNITKGTKIFELPEKMTYKIGVMTVESQTITTLNLVRNEDVVNSDIIVGISKVENDILIALSNGLINTRLLFNNFSTSLEALITAEGISYFKYRVCVLGENEATGELILSNPEEEIIIYSVDSFYFFSKSYSDHMTKLVSNDLMIDYQPSYILYL